jgi:hypothetical protein
MFECAWVLKNWLFIVLEHCTHLCFSNWILLKNGTFAYHLNGTYKL